jgi:flavodoxin
VQAKKDVFESYKQLDDSQKDFYDMEKGFNGKNEIPDDCEGLWDNINRKSSDFENLRYGFCGSKGKGVLEALFQNQVLITPNGLLERCKSTGENELKDLLSKIAKAL